MSSEVIELAAGDGRLAVVPGRGALITRWEAGGLQRLYLDEATLADPTKNVRGGVPLLFPSPGKLEDGRFVLPSPGQAVVMSPELQKAVLHGDLSRAKLTNEIRKELAGKSGAMKQHGFARDLPWTVAARNAHTATLTLRSTDATRAQFPWDFFLSLQITLTALRVRLDVNVENPGPDAMPFGFGIHPYFFVPDKTVAAITTAATRAFDNVAKKTVPFTGFHLAEGETDLHLLDHGSTTSKLTTGEGEHVTVRTSKQFGRWVVWTLPGKEFVCLEPWTAPGNALNTGEGLITLAAGESSDLWIELDAG
jgi:galactose mutarotase-like enzyme